MFSLALDFIMLTVNLVAWPCNTSNTKMLIDSKRDLIKQKTNL